jgi:hypothetical protein
MIQLRNVPRDFPLDSDHRDEQTPRDEQIADCGMKNLQAEGSRQAEWPKQKGHPQGVPLQNRY